MTEPEPLREPSARRFAAHLAAQGLTRRVLELPESTRTAADAARAVGCQVRQIVKSLVFRAGAEGPPVLFLVAGSNRVDPARAAELVGVPLERADPEFVRSVTGYAIGGVPPAGHARSIPAYVDYELLAESELWAAAGHPHAVFRLKPLELLRLTRARPVPLDARPPGPAPGARWVTFDCYGTLIDWRAGLIEAARRRGWVDSAESGDAFFAAYLAAEPAVEGAAYRPYREIVAATVGRVGEQRGHRIAPGAAAEFVDSVPEWPAFADAAPLLRELRARGRRVAILSNIDRDLLAATLARHDLEVDRTVTAEEVRSYKPAPAHWIRFLRATGADPRSTLHVSASYEYDLETAGLLGGRTAYVARYGPLPAERPVDRRLADLASAAELLGEA
ncbi:MAG TPA: YbaK/EbsC family protein [Thermoplasmata archaeon]|nr:YbaK/EbsC family protein [Thermoplasmata archaeon]